MEPSVSAFLNAESRWPVKDFRTLRRLVLASGRVSVAPDPQTRARPGGHAPCGPSGASARRAEPAPGLPAPRFLENPVSGMLISAWF